MKRITQSLAVVSLFAVLPLSLAPAENAVGGGETVVVELFTSQSCFSCPPAEAFLGELLESAADILALEWHVDYWDDLVYGSAGRWKDLFSDPAFTARQRQYNESIRGRRSVYTPQMIVGGREEAVGSRRNEVNAAIEQVRQTSYAVDVAIEAAGDGWRISLDGDKSAEGSVWLVNYDLAHTTEVLRGENKGKTLTNHHVVRTVQRVGRWGGEPVTIDAADQRQGEQGCAVLVQSEALGPLLGAAACPDPVRS